LKYGQLKFPSVLYQRQWRILIREWIISLIRSSTIIRLNSLEIIELQNLCTDPENLQTRYDATEEQSTNVKKKGSKNYVARIQVGDLKLAFIGLHILAQPMSEERRFEK